ncbi:sterol desaturase family protein [Sinimarinibacterium sp. CAU 1509]|uniref:sterol desaturase family protein n=1 Tax=Sinimarinibacterium sp. CAU 1509 TaxID=2562283 RepID=UPI0010ABFA32|nr:sterol desaturase family protein [Sinimarinibacterium sp. CAU 1509]TJY58277.1 sterol desaturase family protein [Sinimarinibacterium sp. CAU 1509]
MIDSLQTPTAIRLMIFIGLIVVLLLAESRWPRRGGERLRGLRWPANLGLVVIDSIAVRLLLGAGAVGVALWAEARPFGLFPLLALPAWISGLLGIVLLDLLIYFQHRVFHAVPPLWRLHRVHHSDIEFDVTTAVRFHPLEILASMLIKMAAVALLGVPAWAVVAFEALLNGTAMFNHANLALPSWLDRGLRWVVVTPDVHRVHHSVHRDETDSNFGFNVPWWDRLFGTYREQPRDGHAAMQIGLERFREPQRQRLRALLEQPLRPGS